MKACTQDIDRRLNVTENGSDSRERTRNLECAIRNCRRSAFTLIELLLVLVILATLATIVTPKFTKHSEKARITKAITQISNFDLALDAFEIDMSRYPTTIEGLRALVERPAADADDWNGPYLKNTIPLDPWGNEYVYRYPGQYNLEGCDLYSFGPDRKQGGDDDIANWSEDLGN